MSSTTELSCSQYVRSLPTLSQAAAFIGLDTGGMSRAVRSLGIEPQRWGRRDKHLAVGDVLHVARVAQRASLEEVAGAILEWTEREHPQALDVVTAEIDEFFAQLPVPSAGAEEELLAELRQELPERWARKAEQIWRAHAASVK